MKKIINKMGLFIILFLATLTSFADAGRGGASGDDNEWLQFLIVGLVVGAIVGFFIGRSTSKK